jgi:sugar phosphate isomerase/epimerase
LIPNGDISFQLFSAERFPPLSETLRTLAELGYTDVQPYNQYDELKSFRDSLDGLGLTCKTGHFKRWMLDGEFDRVLEIAGTLGMSLIALPMLYEHERPADVAGWREFGAYLDALAGRLGSEGLAFAWHNHDFEFRPLADGSLPIEHVLGEKLSWEPDIGWMTRAGADPIAWIERYSGRIPAVHIKDLAPEGECLDEDGWADIGSGRLPIADIWEAGVAAGSQLMVVEHDLPSDYRRFAANSIRWIRDNVV